MARLREMLLHQIGQIGGELLYPATAKYLVRSSSGREPPRSASHSTGTVWRPSVGPYPPFPPAPASESPTLIRFLNVVLGKLDTDPSRLRLYQEIGMFEGDYLSLGKVRENSRGSARYAPLPRLLPASCNLASLTTS